MSRLGFGRLARTVLVLARLKPIERMNVMADKKKRNLTPKKRAMLRWTGKEIDQLLEYKATGFKHSEIGELMGRSTKSINVKMSKIRLGVEKASNPVEDLTPFQKNLDSTLFGDVSPDDKPKKPRKPRATKLSLTPQPLVTDAFNVPKKPVYAAVVLALVIVAWYLGSMS
jgi:hypothetical protein